MKQIDVIPGNSVVILKTIFTNFDRERRYLHFPEYGFAENRKLRVRIGQT